MSVPILLSMPFSTQAAFAIAKLETTFFQAAVRLNEGRDDDVHFAFASLDKGHPPSLPASFSNLIAFDPAAATPESRRALVEYARRAGIRLVMCFDVQPVAPFVGDLHGAGVRCVLSYWGAPISDPMPPLRLLLNRLQLAMAGRRRVDGLIFESRAMADLAVTGRGASERSIDVVPTGVDAMVFRPEHDKGYAHEVFGVPRSRRIVVFSGHAHERKGMGPLMDAVRILIEERGRRDLFLLVCGDRGTEAEKWMARLGAGAASEWVRFAGYRTDIAALMRHSDVGVIPSSGWDSFPMSALEMAASGLPVVATRLGGIPEGVLDGETGLLCEPGDARSLADALARLLDDPALAARLGRAGRARVEREFTLDAHEARLVDVWRRRLAATIS